MGHSPSRTGAERSSGRRTTPFGRSSMCCGARTANRPIDPSAAIRPGMLHRHGPLGLRPRHPDMDVRAHRREPTGLRGGNSGSAVVRQVVRRLPNGHRRNGGDVRPGARLPGHSHWPGRRPPGTTSRPGDRGCRHGPRQSLVRHGDDLRGTVARPAGGGRRRGHRAHRRPHRARGHHHGGQPRSDVGHLPGGLPIRRGHWPVSRRLSRRAVRPGSAFSRVCREGRSGHRRCVVRRRRDTRAAPRLGGSRSAERGQGSACSFARCWRTRDSCLSA